MTQDEIIDKDEVLKMAIKVGFTGTASEFYMKALEHFAKLVAAKERERASKAASKAILNAVENEREACANLCEDQTQEYYSDGSKRAMNYQCADAIRARGEPTSRGEAA